MNTGLNPKFDDAIRALAERVSNGMTEPSVTVGPITLAVHVEWDTDADPTECDEYSKTDVDTFRSGEWRFIGIRASIAGVESGGIWAVELGRTEGNVETEYLADVIAGELGEAADLIRTASEALSA